MVNIAIPDLGRCWYKVWVVAALLQLHHQVDEGVRLWTSPTQSLKIPRKNEAIVPPAEWCMFGEDTVALHHLTHNRDHAHGDSAL